MSTKEVNIHLSSLLSSSSMLLHEEASRVVKSRDLILLLQLLQERNPCLALASFRDSSVSRRLTLCPEDHPRKLEGLVTVLLSHATQMPSAQCSTAVPATTKWQHSITAVGSTGGQQAQSW